MSNTSENNAPFNPFLGASDNTTDMTETSVSKSEKVQTSTTEAQIQNTASEEKVATSRTSQNEKVIQDPVQKKIANENNISNFGTFVIGTNDELSISIKADFDEDSRDAKEKSENPSDYLITAVRAERFGMQTQNQILQQRFLDALLKTNTEFEEVRKELRLARVSAASYLKKAQENTLTGNLGELAVIAATQGSYRVILYNSGFNITLRPMTLEMANEFIQAVDREFEDLGRILGGFYHLPLSVFLKQKIAEFLPSLIIGSNLKNWRDQKTLLSAISYNDYETILWAICSMMFRDGIGIGLLCANKDCRNHEVNQFIDLTKVCYLNLNKLNGDAVAWLMKTTNQVTLDDVLHYRKDIIKNLRTFTPEESSITYYFCDPSLQTYTTYGIDIIGKLADAINMKSEIIFEDDSDKIKAEKEEKNRKEKQQQLNLSLYKMLVPWIDHVEITEKINGNPVVTKITGYDAISASLELRTKYSTNLYNQLEDFIRDSRCAFFCVNHLKCPKCGKLLNYNKNEMTTLDVEYIFFCLSCLMLAQTGLGEI